MKVARVLRRLVLGRHIAELEKQRDEALAKLRWLRVEMSHLQSANAVRNAQLAALHVVWCNGGCAGGVGCRETVDEALVVEAERNVARLRSWWQNRKYRDAREAALPADPRRL